MFLSLSLTVMGFFIVGVIFGFYAYRELARYAARSRHEQGVCASCGEKAYVTECDRCGLTFAMCHNYSILGTDDPNPAKLKKRRSAVVCVVCLSARERETIERILNP
jgi:hypothetical protein